MVGGLRVISRFVLLLCLCYTAPRSLLAAWQVEPVDLAGNAGWSLSLDIDPQGTPHALYFYSGGDERYAARGEAGWTLEAEIENAETLAFDPSGDLYFVSKPGSTFFPQYQFYPGNGLLLGDTVANYRVGDPIDLYYDGAGNPIITLVDTVSQRLLQADWDGQQWSTTTVASGPEFRITNANVVTAQDADGEIHYAWRDESDSVRYANPTGFGWTVTTPFGTADSLVYDMVVGDDGTVRIAHEVYGGAPVPAGLYLSRNTGGPWTIEFSPTLSSIAPNGAQVVLDPDGKPHVFAFDNTGLDDLTHFYKDNNEWKSRVIDSFAGSSSGPEEIEATSTESALHVLVATGDQELYYASYEFLPGDLTYDGIVDHEDIEHWKARFDGLSGLDVSDLMRVQRNYGSGAALTGGVTLIPEPSSLVLVLAGLACARRRGPCRR